MSVSFENPLSEEGKSFLHELIGKPVAADEKQFLFDNMPTIEPAKMDQLVVLAGQPLVVKLHELDDVKTLSDGTRYIVTDKGWAKILDAGETRVAAVELPSGESVFGEAAKAAINQEVVDDFKANAPDSADDAAGADSPAADQPGGIHGGPDDGSAKPAAEDAEASDELTSEGLPRWQCHKTVEAFKIIDIEALSNGRVQLLGEGDQAIVCDAAYVDKHRPQVGGYYVKYHDGYASWSPADAFEDGYTPVEI